MDPKCRDELKGFTHLYWIAVGVAAVTGALLLAAIVANLGFFTSYAAPALMAAGGGMALMASSTFLSQIPNLESFKRNGCLPAQCSGHYDALMRAFKWALAAFALLSAEMFTRAAWTAIPYAGSVVLLIIAATTAAFAAKALNDVKGAIEALEHCVQEIARAIGPLLPGEKASDPFFLRLGPLDGVRYTYPVENSTALIQENAISHRFLRCVRLSVGVWEIQAVAWIDGAAGERVTFSWFLGSTALGAGTTDADGRRSVLVHRTPLKLDEIFLRVEAVHVSGMRKTRQDPLELPPTHLDCNLTVTLPEFELRSPAIPEPHAIPDIVERLRPAFDAFHRTADDILVRGAIGNRRKPIDKR